MRFAGLSQRVGGEGVAAWAVHSEAMGRLRAGEDIILLSVGQENNEFTPEPIQQAAIDSIRSGRHHYTGVKGDPRLRAALAQRHQALTGQQVSADNVCIFAGAQNALFASALCLLEAGDEVIVLEPYYVTYPATFTATGARLINIPLSAESGFQPDPAVIAAAITPATRALVINSPNNPTGAVYSRQCLQALVDLCRQHELWIISDEVYAELAEPADYTHIASLPDAAELTVTIGSLSKSHRMTGWRCGWAIAPIELAEHFANLCLCMCYGLPGFTQDAALRAIQDDINIVAQLRTAFSRRHHVMVEEFAHLDDVTVYGHPGSMFGLLDIRAYPVSGPVFVKALLDQYGVSILPCDGFGTSGKGLLRVSLTESEARLRRACQSVGYLLASYRNKP